MLKILLESNHASGCQTAAAGVKKKKCAEDRSFFQLPFWAARGSCSFPVSPKLCQVPCSPLMGEIPQPLVVFISSAEATAKGEELTHLGSQALQL